MFHGGILRPTESISEVVTWSNNQIVTISNVGIGITVNCRVAVFRTLLHTSSDINPRGWLGTVEVDVVESCCGIDTTSVSCTVIWWDNVAQVTIAESVEGSINTGSCEDNENQSTDDISALSVLSWEYSFVPISSS